MKKSQVFIAPGNWELFFIFLIICCAPADSSHAQSVKPDDKSSVSIQKVVMVKEVHADGTVGQETNIFSTNSAFFHAVVYYKDATANTQLVVKWENRDTKTLILKNTYTLSPDELRAVFNLSRPYNGWPEGNYKVSFLHNNILLYQRAFEVKK